MKSAKAHSPPSPASSRLVPAGAWLQDLFSQIAVHAQTDAEWIPDSPKLAIHRLRKRMKKLQSLLQLAESIEGDEAMAAAHDAIHEIKDALAARRDADVLTALEHDLGTASIKVRSVRPNLTKLRELLGKLTDTTHEMNLGALNWEGITASHLKTCHHARKAWKKAQRHPSAKALHSWRKRVKDQYHQSLALHRWLGQNGRLRRMRRLGSLLGRCHDLDLFASAVPSKGSKKVRRKVGDRREKLKRRVFRRAKKVFSHPLSKSKRRLSAELLLEKGARRQT